MARYAIKHSDGTHVCYVNSLERVGKWMGERHVLVDVSSPVLLDFQIGDYIDYSGERFTLYYDPSVLKQARRMTSGEAFVYNGIKFDGCTNNLRSIRFYDYVHGDSGIHFSQTRQFSFYCANIVDFANRVQANLDRWYEEQIKVGAGLRFKPWRSRVNADAESSTEVTIEVQSQTVWQVLENVQTKFNTTFTVREHEGYCEIVYGDDGKEDLNGVDAFEYGMNKGLISIERNSQKSAEEQMYTRLRAYGSTKNLPAHYYSEPHEPWYRLKKDKDWFVYKNEIGTNGKPYLQILVNVYYVDSSYGTHSFYIEGYRGRVFRPKSIPFVKEQIGEEIPEKYKGYAMATLVRVDFENGDAMKNVLLNAEYIVFMSGFLKKYTTHHKEWWISPYPINANNYAVLNLMLPKFYSYRVVDEDGKEVWLNPATCTILYEDNNNLDKITGVMSNGVLYYPIYKTKDNGDIDYTQIDFNEDAYIDDKEGIAKYGIIEGELYFDNDNEGFSEIYPTIEGVRADDARAAGYDISLADGDNGFLDEFAFSAGQYYNENKEIKDAPTDLSKAFEDFVPFGTDGYGDDGVQRTTDDPNIWEGKKRQFYVFTKDLGFDPKAYLGTSDAEISIKSGKCTARSFKLLGSSNGVANNPVQVEKDGVKYWRFHCERYFDQTLGVHYPNNLDTISGEPTEDYRREDAKQGILHSDRFVLLNFELPRMYVDAASARLQRAAEEYFENTRKKSYIYVPKIDSVMIKRNKDICGVTGEKSFHDILQEGLIMKITDEDLGISDGIDRDNTKFYIETLTVKETGDKIPEYTVVLKDKAELTSLQKIQKQITTIGDKLNSILSGNSNVVIYGSENNLVANGGNVGGTGSSSGSSVSEEDVTRIGDGRYARIAEENRFEAENWFTDVHGNGFYTDAASEGVEDYGASMYDEEGLGYVQTDYLNVRRAAFFRTLTIAEVEHMGGEVILSAAACKVAMVDDTLPDGDVRIFFEKRANGRETYNEWQVGDQAYCQRWDNGRENSNVFYWKLVTEVNTGGLEDYWDITISGRDEAQHSGTPQVNDEIVLLGHRNGGYRASAQVYSTIGDDAPSRKYYYGITSYELPKPIELMEHTEEGAHWKVGGEKNNYIEYDGDLKIKANSVEIVSDSGTTNVGEALEDNFRIWQAEENAIMSGDDFETMVDYSVFGVSNAWAEEGSLIEHVGDYLVTKDGVAYKFVVDEDDPSEPYWEICSDQYLLAAMAEAKKATRFVAGFTSENGFAKMFSAVVDADGNVIKSGDAGTFVTTKVDEEGNDTDYITGFKINTDVFVCNADNMKVDEEGNLECQNARIRGFIYRDEIIITPGNVSDYLLDSKEWYFKMGTGALPNGAIVLDVRKTGPNFVVQGNFGAGSFVNIVLPSLFPDFQINTEQLSVVRSMSGETMCITNNTALPIRIYCVNANASGGYDRGLIGTNLSIGYQRTLACTRTFASTSGNGFNLGDEIVYWEAVGGDKKATYHTAT